MRARDPKPSLPSSPPIPARCAKQTGIVIAGSAGQKIRSTATLFAEASIFAGLSATQKDDYPITVQTGHSVSEIIVSPERIDYTGIDSPDFLVVLSADGPAQVRARIEALSTSCISTQRRAWSSLQRRRGSAGFPSPSWANGLESPTWRRRPWRALLEESGIFPREAFATAIESFQRGKIAELNLKAASAGAELAGSRS